MPPGAVGTVVSRRGYPPVTLMMLLASNRCKQIGSDARRGGEDHVVPTAPSVERIGC
jgi:hypothetical protein